MAILAFCAFLSQDADEFRSLNGTASIDSGTVYGSLTRSGRVNPTTTGTGNLRFGATRADGRVDGEFSTNDLYVGFMFRVATAPASGHEEIFITTVSGGGDYKAAVCLTSSRTLAVYESDGTATGISLEATGSTVLSLDTWYWVEWRGSNGTNSAYELRINGVTELSGTCNQKATSHGNYRLGKTTNRNSQSVNFYYGYTVARDDDFPEQGEFALLLPNGNGSLVEWTGGTGSTFTEVNQLPSDGDTTYWKKSSAAAQTHYVTFENCSDVGITGSDNILAVKLHTRMREDASVTSSVRARMNSNSTAVETSGFNADTTWRTYNLIRETDPDTSSAWTTSGIDALEGGVRDSTTTTGVRCSAVYLIVYYTAGGTTYNDPLTESLTGADSYAAVVTFVTTVSESATGADSLAVAATANTALSEGLTGSDSVEVAATYPATRSESITAADSQNVAVTFNATVTESLTAADALSALATIAATLSETLTGADSVDDTVTFAASLAEALSAAASEAAAATFNTTLSDSLAAGDSYSDGGAQTYNETLSAAIVAADSLAAIATFAATRAESVTAAETLSSIATMASEVFEALTTSDALTAQNVIGKTLAENVTADETTDAANVAGATLSESLDADESFAAAATFAGSVEESTTADDDWHATTTFSPELLEALTALTEFLETSGALPPGLSLYWRVVGGRIHFNTNGTPLHYSARGRLHWTADSEDDG